MLEISWNLGNPLAALLEDAIEFTKNGAVNEGSQSFLNQLWVAHQ
jgi:hypothetical protein